jgi:hypothetical protein
MPDAVRRVVQTASRPRMGRAKMLPSSSMPGATMAAKAWPLGSVNDRLHRLLWLEVTGPPVLPPWRRRCRPPSR